MNFANATLLKKRLWHRCFPEFRGISKNTICYRSPLMAASDYSSQNANDDLFYIASDDCYFCVLENIL